MATWYKVEARAGHIVPREIKRETQHMVIFDTSFGEQRSYKKTVYERWFDDPVEAAEFAVARARIAFDNHSKGVKNAQRNLAYAQRILEEHKEN